MHQHWFSVFSFYIDSEGELSQSHGIKYYVPCDNSQISSPASNSSSRGTRICNWLVNSSILTLNRNLKFNIFITWALDFHPQPFKKIAHLVFPHFCNKLCSSSCLGQKLEVVLYLIFFLFHRHPNQHLIALALLSIDKCMHLRIYVFTHTYLSTYFPFHLPPSTLPSVFFSLQSHWHPGCSSEFFLEWSPRAKEWITSSFHLDLYSNSLLLRTISSSCIKWLLPSLTFSFTVLTPSWLSLITLI